MTQNLTSEGDPDDNPEKSRTLAAQVFEDLRADIVKGRLEPGRKLPFEVLRKTYGVGLSPLREALSRLAENRLVESTGQRGFRVMPASIADIQDIAMVRKNVEGLALRRSIELGDDTWEANVVASRHRLLLLSREGRPVNEEDWDQRHREFHYSLVAGCQSNWLLHFHETLNDQFDRYRRLATPDPQLNPPRQLVHDQFREAALSRDADLAVKLLCKHIDEALKLIVLGLDKKKNGR